MPGRCRSWCWPAPAFPACSGCARPACSMRSGGRSSRSACCCPSRSRGNRRRWCSCPLRFSLASRARRRRRSMDRPPLPATAFDWVAAAEVVILIGITARLAWIALGMIRLRRMRRLATEPAAGFDDLRQAIGAVRADPVVVRGAASGHLRPLRSGRPPAGLAQGGRSSGAARRGRARAPSRHAPRLGLGDRRGAGPLGVLVPSGDVVAGVARAARARDGGRRAVDPGDQRAPHVSRHAPGVRRRLRAGFVPGVLGEAPSVLPRHAAVEGG